MNSVEGYCLFGVRCGRYDYAHHRVGRVDPRRRCRRDADNELMRASGTGSPLSGLRPEWTILRYRDPTTDQSAGGRLPAGAAGRRTPLPLHHAGVRAGGVQLGSWGSWPHRDHRRRAAAFLCAAPGDDRPVRDTFADRMPGSAPTAAANPAGAARGPHRRRRDRLAIRTQRRVPRVRRVRGDQPGGGLRLGDPHTGIVAPSRSWSTISIWSNSAPMR